MKTTRFAFQENLFESSRDQELQRRVKELDVLIARELKKNNYDRAKTLTEQQKRCIQELVEMGEG